MTARLRRATSSRAASELRRVSCQSMPVLMIFAPAPAIALASCTASA